MRAILSCALGLLLCCPLPAEEKKAGGAIDAKKLVGRWAAKEGGESVVAEFGTDGMLTFTFKDGEKLSLAYAVGGDKLIVLATVLGTEVTSKATILELTDTELVTRDEGGKEERLVRLKAK
jgi:uncharacterized protein (TIGR03066 family)